MARYRRALRGVVNGWVGLSLLFGGLPAPQLAVPATPEVGTADLDVLSDSSDYPLRAVRAVPGQTDEAAQRPDLLPPSGSHLLRTGPVARAATGASGDGAGQARPFVPRALPVTLPGVARLVLPAWQATLTPTLTATVETATETPIPNPTATLMPP